MLPIPIVRMTTPQGISDTTMIFNTTRDSVRESLANNHRCPDGLVDLGDVSIHLQTLIATVKQCNYGRRSSTIDLVSQLAEVDLHCQLRQREVDVHRRSVAALCAAIARGIMLAAVLRTSNSTDGFDSPSEALAHEFPRQRLERLHGELRQVPYWFADDSHNRAYVDLTGCSTLDGPLAVNAFLTFDDEPVEDQADPTSRKVNLSEILDRLGPEDPDTSNPYDDDGWQPWYTNLEPPYEDP